MLPGWTYFRDKMPFCKKNVAQEGGGCIFEVGVFSQDYGNGSFGNKSHLPAKSLNQKHELQRNACVMATEIRETKINGEVVKILYL